MMIEPLYDFSLTAEQEARARTLHESSIILDMLFQGPVGTYSLPEGAEEELLALAQEACPGDEIAQCNWATAEILRRMIGGSYSQLYKDCWYDSGLTGGCRQLSVTDRDEALRSAVELQAEFDTYPWLVKCTSVEQIRRCKKEGLKAGIVTSQEAEGYSKDLKLLELLYNYGLRVQQLSYNNQNLIGAGCMEPNGGAGLSKFGIRFVEKCNELGIVVDTGHCGYHTIALAATVVSSVLGIILGAIPAYYGGATDSIIMRTLDVFMAIPSMLLMITLVNIMKPTTFNLIIAMSISGVPSIARIVRGQMLSVMRNEYVEAVRGMGASGVRIVVKHVLPNAISPLIAQIVSSVAGEITMISTLSYIGLGVQQPAPEWGSMLAAGQQFIRDQPYLTIFPGLAIVITIISLTLMGDGLRDALDPRMKR